MLLHLHSNKLVACSHSSDYSHLVNSYKIVLTLTSHSSILWVAICTGDSWATWTTSEFTLTATTVNIVQVNWTSTSTKMSTAECYCICLCKIWVLCTVVSHDWVWTMLLTLSGVSQLPTHHSGISISPQVVTHSTPLTVQADFHSAFILNVSSYQSQLTSCTWSCMHKRVSL